MDRRFTEYSNYLSDVLGTPRAFVIACMMVVLWGLTGPLFHFSDTWQLIINSTTNIVEFLMLFLIQNTQNRFGSSIQIKLDELIRANKAAHNALLDIESLTEQQLEKIRKEYVELARIARKEMHKHGSILREDD